MGGRPNNTILLELVIVILFFAISAGVILQLYVAAHEKSAQSAVDTQALMLAEDLAEGFAVSGQSMETFLLEEGFAPVDGTYVRTVAAENYHLRLVAEGEASEIPSGTLDSMTLTIYQDERVAVALPISRYTPEVSAQ